MPVAWRSVRTASTASWAAYLTFSCNKYLATKGRILRNSNAVRCATSGTHNMSTVAVPKQFGSLDVTSLGPPPAPQKVKVALCQLHVTADKIENIAAARAAIAEAAANGAQLVVLPEMWNCPYANSSFPVYAEVIDSEKDASGPSFQALSQAAEQHKVVLVGGSIPERDANDDNKLFNTCCIFGPDGKLLSKHRKLHLFDIDIPGKITFKESDTLTPGSGPTVVDTPLCRLGIGICYDIRFPELACLYNMAGVQLIVYPGAFNTVTGPLHWELLQRARAVDNQCFVATCSPARNPDSTYQAWGHSTAVGPFAEILATTDHDPAIVYADMDFNQIYERRANMPLNKQRRTDVFVELPIAPLGSCC